MDNMKFPLHFTWHFGFFRWSGAKQLDALGEWVSLLELQSLESDAQTALSLKEEDMKALEAANKREEERFVQHVRLPLKAFSSFNQN